MQSLTLFCSIVIFGTVSSFINAIDIELSRGLEPESKLEELERKCNQQMDMWENRLKKVEENFQMQLDQLKSKMANSAAKEFTTHRTSLWREDDEQDGEGVRHHLDDEQDGGGARHHHLMHKRESKQSSKLVLPFCANSSKPCSYFYRERPDMKRPIMVGKDLCIFYHPDHPDSKVVSLKPVETMANLSSMPPSNGTKSESSEKNKTNNLSLKDANAVFLKPVETMANLSNNSTLSSGAKKENSERNATNNLSLKDAKKFYGPPASCEELQKLGYSLNGFYLVNGESKFNKKGFEIVLCRFEDANGSTNAKEERFALFAMDVSKSKTPPLTATSSSPVSEKSLENEISTVSESPIVFGNYYMNSMNTDTFEMPSLSDTSFGVDDPFTPIENLENEISDFSESPMPFESNMNSMDLGPQWSFESSMNSMGKDTFKTLPIFDSSSHTAPIKKGKQSNCIPLWQLRIGEPLNCLTVENSMYSERTILSRCDDYYQSEQTWSMIESGNAGTRICQVESEKCLTYDPKGMLGPTISLMMHDEKAKTQLFKMNITTSQLVIVASGSCMVGVFRSSPLVSTEEVQTCDGKPADKTYKKWSVVPLKNCE